MMEKDKKTQFDVKTFRIVDDIEVNRSYNWSSIFYQHLVSSMKTMLDENKESYYKKIEKNLNHHTFYCV